MNESKLEIMLFKVMKLGNEMTIRQRFVMAAMEGILSGDPEATFFSPSQRFIDFDDLAKTAVELADECLKAEVETREK